MRIRNFARRLLLGLIGGSIYGRLMLFVGLLVAAPLAALAFYPEERSCMAAFLIPAAFAIVAGAAVCVVAPRREAAEFEWQSPLQKGSLPVLFAWCFAFLMGAAPFVLSGLLTPALALFESVSGWTATGFTVVDVEALPRVFLFHRSFMQFCGGLGFIIMFATLVQGKQAVNLYNAEGHQDRIMPKLRRTARVIFLLYSGFLAAGVALYRAFGMGAFDAVCHAMSALSTAGFSTRADGIAGYGSAAIEGVTIALMLAGSTNFAILLLLVKGKFRQASRISELRFMAALALGFTLLCALSLALAAHGAGGAADGAGGAAQGAGGADAGGIGIIASLRAAFFGVVSTFSTTGYATMDYTRWPPFAMGLLMLLMLVGGGMGSTAGGMKLARACLLIKITHENIRKRISPACRLSAPHYHRVQGKTPIDDALAKDTVGFIACYIGVLIAGTLLLALAADCTLFEAMFEFSSAFGTVGITNGLTHANASTATLAIEMIGMILGRLEIFIVFVGVYSSARTLKRRLAKITEKLRSQR